MLHGGREVEIKLAVSSAAEARRVLRAAGFRVSKRRVLEKNTVFDTGSQTLRKSARLLRVRTTGKIATLTYKGPPDVGRHKSREELELELSDAHVFGTILERLEYLPAFRYEKFRTEFRKGRAAGVVTVDETPIGVYLELEGSPEWIDRTARNLGYADKDYITASYARLYIEWSQARGMAPTDMLFT